MPVIAALIGCGQAEHPAAPLSTDGLIALNWIAEEADPVDALTLQPATCLNVPETPAAEAQILYGELLFNSPYLLGGQAARADLSCASCHRNGRGNSHFVFKGLSGLPGTADVTHGLFGPDRADDIFNPVPIPDLAAPEGQQRIDRTDFVAVQTFLESQITEEFSGEPPPPTATKSLVTYLQALDASACSGNDIMEPISWQVEALRVRSAILAREEYAASDPDSAKAFALAGRAALGRLHARYVAPEHERLRQRLIALSRQLQIDAPAQILLGELRTIEGDLEKSAETSLYNPDVLRTALAVEISSPHE